MKRTILLALGAFAFVNTQAQQAAPTTGKFVKVPAQIANKAYTYNHNNFVNAEFSAPAKQGNPTTNSVQAAIDPEVLIGQTRYDLQTNSSVQNRIVNHGGGQVSAVWTFGKAETAFPERGTGFNYRDGANWTQPTGLEDIVRVENIRTGFPSLDRIAGKGDVVVAHDLDGNAQLAQNNNVGDAGSWSNAVTPMTNTFWNRMKVAGPDGKTIHNIALTTPTTGTPAGTPFQGIDGALVYSRSLNGGQTWDKVKVLLPGIDSTLFKRFSGDAYAIDAKGNTVAFVVGGFNNDMFVMKSTDNGDTWTKTTIMDFPIDAYDDDLSDENNDGIADTIDTNDGSMAIIIDNNDMVHAFTGAMRMFNDDTTDGTYSYFPGTSGILYWNETFGTDSTALIADIVDRDGSGTLDIGATIPVYQMGLTSMPSVGIDASNNLYVVYSSIADNTFLDDRSYRHLFAVTSGDAGANWTFPVEVTPFDEFTEYVYGSVARTVDNKVHIVYQSDGEPGIATSPDTDNPHFFSDNNIIYLTVDPAYLVTGVKENQTNFASVAVYPNPATNQAQLTFTLKNNATINASLVNVMGQKVQSINGGNFAPGTHTVNLDVNALSSGIYFITLNTGNDVVTKKLIVR